MNVLAVAKGVLAITSLVTLGVMVVAGGPWTGLPPGDQMTKLMLFPFIAAWAIAPYFLAHRLALMSEGQEGWLLVAAGPVSAVPVLWLYVNKMILTPEHNTQELVAFILFPVFQALFVSAVYGATRFWRQFK